MTGLELVTQIAYLLSAVLFILGLKNLSSPETARKGNRFAMLGMFLAVLVTLFNSNIFANTPRGYIYILAGVIIGGTIGLISAKLVEMTAMPQMVAVFNGFGGGASALVAIAEYNNPGTVLGYDVSVTMGLSLLIGTLTFTGSVIAFLKLQSIMKGAPVVLPLHQILNILLLITSITGVVLFVGFPGSRWGMIFLLSIFTASFLMGILLVIPIGGADMPVVISLLNSFSGIAAAMTGFVLYNNVLIISGALVGASGLILTNIMCRAMNRSLANVLFGQIGFDEGAEGGKERESVTSYTPQDLVMMLDNADSMIIVPGYGLAVAQAQNVLKEVAELTEEKGIDVRYAIHPVAGRMPGHMNVLLAEADVSYEKLHELENINDDFKETDIALVVGANDVTNPAARTEEDSPLYGMPILNVDEAKTIIFLKRSLNPGLSGEDNELFYDDKTMMVFGDAKETLTETANILK